MLSYEKIEALFAEIVTLKDDLGRAIDRANQIDEASQRVSAISEVVNKFNNLEQETANLSQVARKAGTQSAWLASKATLIAIGCLFVSSVILGGVTGVWLGYQKSETLYFQDNRYETLTNELASFYQKREAILELEKKGVRFYGNAITIPEDSVISRSPAGDKAVFLDNQ